MHTKEALTPHLLASFQRAKSLLPADLACRLTSSDHVRNHGSYRTFYLFNVWDVHQADILHRDHFCYCFAHFTSAVLQQRKNDGHAWGLHLWINTIRLYRSQQAIRDILESDLRDACPAGFTYRCSERAVEIKTSFDFCEPLAELPTRLVPLYTKLIRAAHPVLLPIIDAFTEPLSSEERRAAILGRKRKYYGPASHPPRQRIREHSRSIPPAWRPKILAKFGHKCTRCGTPLTVRTAHMDHIVPFSDDSEQGGTTFENLQPLCAPCNLKKGNRERF